MSRKEKRKHHHSQANKDHPARIQGNLPSQAPAINADAPHGETAHEGGQNDKEPAEMPRRPDWMTIFTGILALFAFLSFIAVGIQLKDARKALEVDQRPWVTIGPDWPKEQTAQGVVGQKVVLNENSRIQVPIKIENSGKTPALQLSYTANIEIVEREKSPQLENPKNPIRVVGGTLFPHAPVTDFAYRWNPQKPGMNVFDVLTPRGVNWEDYNGKRLTIRQSVWHTHTTAPKTEDAASPVPVIETLAEILGHLRELDGNPESGPILRGPSGKPLNLDNLSKRTIIPILEAASQQWHGWYSLRRGVATTLAGLTQDGMASKGLLRHTNLATTTRHYIKDVPENTLSAMNQLETLFNKCSTGSTDRPN